MLDKLLGGMNNNTMLGEEQAEMMKSFVGELLKKLEPQIDSAVKKLEEYMGKDERFMLLKKDGDELFVVIVESESVRSMDIEDKGIKVFNAKDALKSIISGDFDFFEELKNGNE